MPVVVIDKDPSNRMASTIRHNRARGTHNIELTSNIVPELVRSGMSSTAGRSPNVAILRRAHLWTMSDVEIPQGAILRHFTRKNRQPTSPWISVINHDRPTLSPPWRCQRAVLFAMFQQWQMVRIITNS